MKTENPYRTLRLLAACGFVAVFAACPSDSPTEPTPSPGPPPGGGGGGAATFTVTLTAVPNTVPAGSTDPVVITIRAVRADNGQPVGDGTPAIVFAPTGSFGAPGGPNQIEVVLTNGTGQVLYFPSVDAAGAVTVQANVSGSTGSTTITVTEAETFFISFVDPNVGTPSGGEEAVIHGSGFDEPVRVSFGNANARVLSVSPTRIRVIVPESPGLPNQRLTVAVTVTINVNQPDEATDTLPGAFTFAPGGSPDVPTIFSLTPTTGPNEGGTRVLINGSGFAAPVQVELCLGGTCLEAQVVSVASSQIEILTPSATGFGQALQNQSVDVRVRNLDSGLVATSAGAFRYGTEVIITSMGPNEGPYFGGTIVTIFGQGFDAPVASEFGGQAQVEISVTGTEIVARAVGITTTSCADVGAGEGVSVVNIESGIGATAGIDFIYRVVAFSPLISSVLPSSGPQGGGTTVTIRGTNLLNPRVTFGNRPAEILSVAADGSQVTVRTPSLPDELLRTEACDDNGDGTQGQRFLPTAIDVRLVNLATTCEDLFDDAFTYTPTNTSCRNDVGPPPAGPPVECEDGFDNDGDGFIDELDPECTGPGDDDESA